MQRAHCYEGSRGRTGTKGEGIVDGGGGGGGSGGG